MYEEARAERAEAKALALVAQLHAQHAVDLCAAAESLQAHPLESLSPAVAPQPAAEEAAQEEEEEEVESAAEQ
jgi:hypothetical protein